jgi:hypothetical protein
MTRREEIEHAWFSKAVQSNHRYDEKSFKEAVEWADRTMIEKACKWLFENVYDYLNPEDQERVESFRKYLEE